MLFKLFELLYFVGFGFSIFYLFHPMVWAINPSILKGALPRTPLFLLKMLFAWWLFLPLELLSQKIPPLK